MTTTENTPPSQQTLASAIGVSRRRIRQLIADGMPTTTLEAALVWRKAETVSDSADELRRARIALVKSQRERIEIENAKLRGELIPISQMMQDILTAVSAIRAEFLKLESELPPRLEGLPPQAMQRILRTEIHGILGRLSDESMALFEAHESTQSQSA